MWFSMRICILLTMPKIIITINFDLNYLWPAYSRWREMSLISVDWIPGWALRARISLCLMLADCCRPNNQYWFCVIPDEIAAYITSRIHIIAFTIACFMFGKAIFPAVPPTSTIKNVNPNKLYSLMVRNTQYPHLSFSHHINNQTFAPSVPTFSRDCTHQT